MERGKGAAHCDNRPHSGTPRQSPEYLHSAKSQNRPQLVNSVSAL